MCALQVSLTSAGTFWLFSFMCFINVVFTMIFVPETKGKTLEQIEATFRGTSGPWNLFAQLIVKQRKNEQNNWKSQAFFKKPLNWPASKGILYSLIFGIFVVEQVQTDSKRKQIWFSQWVHCWVSVQNVGSFWGADYGNLQITYHWSHKWGMVHSDCCFWIRLCRKIFVWWLYIIIMIFTLMGFLCFFLSNTWMGVWLSGNEHVRHWSYPHKGNWTLPSTGHSVVGHLYATFFHVGLKIFCQCNGLPAL